MGRRRSVTVRHPHVQVGEVSCNLVQKSLMIHEVEVICKAHLQKRQLVLMSASISKTARGVNDGFHSPLVLTPAWRGSRRSWSYGAARVISRELTRLPSVSPTDMGRTMSSRLRRGVNGATDTHGAMDQGDFPGASRVVYTVRLASSPWVVFVFGTERSSWR